MRIVLLLLLALPAMPLVGEPAPATGERLPNVGFEMPATNGAPHPAGWDLVDGLGVQWTNAADAERGRVIRVDTAVSEADMVARWAETGLEKWIFPNPANSAIAGTYGLSYYSDAIPVETGQAYRISFLYKGPSGGAKVWVRGYGLLRGEERRRYETIVNCRTAQPGWNRLSQAFHPTKHTPAVTTMRVMLYAYWPPGVYEFDDVSIEPVDDATYEADINENVPRD